MKRLISFLFLLIILISLNSQVYGSFELWRTNQEGEDLKQITNVNSPYRIYWNSSPDGDLIVLGSFGGVQIIDCEGVVLNMYPGEKGVIYYPLAWTDEGIYVCINENNYYTKLVLFSASDFQQSAEWKLSIQYLPSLSPDGKHLYYIKKGLFSYAGYLLDLKTGKSKKIGRSYEHVNTKWSHDSKHFTFIDNNTIGSIRNLAGKIVYKFPEESLPLNWSFDNKRILHYNFEDQILYVYDIDKKENITSIASKPVYESEWSRDNEHFVFTELDFQENDNFRRVLVGNINGEVFPVIPGVDKVYNPIWAFNETFIILNKNTLGEFSFKDPSSEYDFRKTNWGMSQAEVLEAEDGALINKKEDALTYAIPVAGFRSSLTYYFEKTGLFIATYNILQNSDETCFTNYEKLKEMLIKEYGEPIVTRVLCKDKEYTGEPDLEAILKNNVRIMTFWKESFLVLFSFEGQVRINICFLDAKYNAIMMK